MTPQTIPAVAKPEPLLLLVFISLLATALNTIATIANIMLIRPIGISDIIPQTIPAIAKPLITLYCC